jgi:DegV family protein with EDD domain
MTPVRVIVDSACALPQDLARAVDLSVVPLRLTIGSESVADGDIPLDQLVGRLDDGVRTSAPSPGEWLGAYTEALDGAEHVMVLTVSDAMSSTFASAKLAASSFDGQVEVVDTGTAAGAEGLVALAAARCAATGGAPDEVRRSADRAIEAVHLIASVGTLQHLVRSGRVPNLAGWAGDRLGVNPLFAFSKGEVKALRPAFSRRSAIGRIEDAVAHTAPHDPTTLRAAVLHALEPEVATRLEGRLRRLAPHGDIFIAPFSAVMVTHTGPGLVGVAWWWDDGGDDR